MMTRDMTIQTDPLTSNSRVQRPAAEGRSLHPVRPCDPAALYIGEGDWVAAGDGTGDDAPVLQAAIDHVAQVADQGIVFVPQGTYRLGRTLNIWRGVRLIGYGRRRPSLLLSADTAGFGDPQHRAYMLHFRRTRPGPGEPLLDAWEGTFHSGIHNIDFEIRDGNPGAVAVRFHVAQLCRVAHADFRIGSGFAGVEAIGNAIESCRFVGGRFGIVTGQTAAGWQALLTDCRFEGQSEACVRTERAGLTAIHCAFSDAPHVVLVPHRGIEQLHMNACRLERIHGSALLLSAESEPGNQIHLEQVACADVSTLVRFRPSGNEVRPAGRCYLVRQLSHGLHLDAAACGWTRQNDTRVRWEPVERLPSGRMPEHRAVPPCSQWANARDFGAVGDGQADDTEALRAAVAAADSVYLPMGFYRICDTLALRPASALIGLHNQRTQIVLAAGTAGFDDPQRPRAMLLAPAGGETIVSGIGLDPTVNPGAVAIRWQAGERSLLEDIWFEWGGHNHDPKGQSFAYSLWVADGGGGVFRNIWSANIGGRNGLYVSDTATPGRVYLMSVEHHRDVEVRLERVRNWTFHALQTEENIGSEAAVAVEMVDCRDLDFTNLFMYRVMALQTAHPHGVAITRSTGIRFRGVHCFSQGRHPFDHAIRLEDSGQLIPERELAWFAC